MSSDKVNTVPVEEPTVRQTPPMQKRQISKQEADAIEELLSESKEKRALPPAPKKRNLMVIVSAMIVVIAIVLVIVYFVVMKKIPKMGKRKADSSEKERFAEARALMERQQHEQLQQFQAILNQKDTELHQLRQQMGVLNEQLVDYKNNAIDIALDKAEQEAKKSEPVLKSELPPKEPVITRAQWLESQKRRKNKQTKSESESDNAEDSVATDSEAEEPKNKSSASEKVENQKRKTSDKLKGSSKEMDTMAAILGSGSLKNIESDEE